MKPIRPLTAVATASAVLVAGVLLAACGGGGSDSSSGGSTDSGSGETQEVTLQLDWTPNTNHTGFYVADQEGYYEEEGVDLKILPYSEAAADTIVGAGKADCGITSEDGLAVAKAAGTEEISVMPILQHSATALIVMKDSEFKSPKDLSGGTYGGFGLPYEVPMVDRMIEYDGGSGDVKNVVLNTGAYEAVYGGKVDTSWGFQTWELIEAAERGIELREFPISEYGVPNDYTVVMACNPDWLKENPELAKSFVEATAKGFEYAIKDPKEASKILIEANPGVFSDEHLVYASSEKLAKEFYPDEEGVFGCQTPEMWSGSVDWLYEEGILTGTDGKPLSEKPAASSFFTNDYLPKACSA